MVKNKLIAHSTMPETQNIRLRALEPEDLSLLYTIENDTDIWDSSNADGPYSRYALKTYIASSPTIRESGEQRFVIDTASPNEKERNPIGIVDLTNYTPLDARAEVGIAFLKTYRNKGYGLQALKALETHATQWLRIHALYAHILKSNEISIHLFENAGYKRVAELPNWHYKGGKYENIYVYMKFFST